MARINKGNALTSKVLQPGWKLSDDGFGLHTISAVYKYDATLGFDWDRGEAFPVSDYNYCKLHKVSLSFDSLGVITATAEYVGINPDINSGAFTNAQMTTTGGLTTEKIETIPNFTFYYSGEPEKNIASPTDGSLDDGFKYTQSEIGPLVSIKDNAQIKTISSNGGMVAVTKQNSFIGANGACFENDTGGKFLGFVNPAYEYFYGKTSYLAPVQTFSGFVYLESEVTANKFLENLGVSSNDGNWSGDLPYIIPTYLTGPFSDPNNDYNQLLLTQSNIESYGNLYKVTFEIKFALVGWHPAIYPEA